MNSPKIPTKRRKNLLNDVQRIAIIEMLAAMMTSTEIIAKVEELYQIKISYKLIDVYKNSPKWAEMLDEKHKKFLSEMATVPIFHPRVRFDRYEKMYQQSLKEKDKVGMASALSLTQGEFGKKVGGDTYNQIFMTQNNVTMSREEIQFKKEKLLNRLKELDKEAINGPDRNTEEN